MATKKPAAGSARKPRARKPAAASRAAAPGRGRPTKFKPEFAAIARALCERGATDAELAAAFQVDTTTIWRWQSAYPDFCKALMVGKDAADNRVERSLYQRAVGYTFHTVKVMQNAGRPVYAPYLEHIPPDPGAAKLWLCNRRPDAWRDRVEFKSEPGLFDLSGLEPDELAVFAQLLDKVQGKEPPP